MAENIDSKPRTYFSFVLADMKACVVSIGGETWFSIIRLYGNRPSRNSFQRREEWSNVDRAWKTHWRTIKAAKHSKVRSTKIDRRVSMCPLPPSFYRSGERASRINSRSKGCFWKLLSSCAHDVSTMRRENTYLLSCLRFTDESRDLVSFLFFFSKFLTIRFFPGENLKGNCPLNGRNFL